MTPIFASVFAEQWDALPPALKAHYANRPRTADRVTVTGTLDITMGPLMRCFAPLLGLFGMLTPTVGKDVPCTVIFVSERDSDAFVFERQFAFPGRKAFLFRSRMMPQGPHEVIEYMSCGVGWRCGYVYENDQVLLQHLGYVWRIFGTDLPISWLGNLLMGHGNAFEEATGAASFRMDMTLSRGLFGRLMAYRYTGEFMVAEMALNHG